MKKLKYQILFIILFMTIGIAAVTSNLVINGNTSLASNPDDFLVYFSDVKVNGVEDLSLVQSETSLVFNGEFSAVGDNKTITYEVTNASKNYDADIEISCTPSTTYLTISNTFDTSSNLSARSTITGTLSITLSKSYTGADITQDISCTINASAVERTTQGSGTVSAPLDPYYIGREISIGEEKFNVISTTEDTITMLARYNLGTDYRQSTTRNYVKFADTDGWEYSSGPKEIDIQTWSTNPKTYVNAYVEFLRAELEDDSVTGGLITLTELKGLGCTINDDYSSTGSETCENSSYKSWLVTDQFWWTRSAYSTYSNDVWSVFYGGGLEHLSNDLSCGLRPTVTISKEVAEQLLNVYPVGKEIAIGDEKFNVISDNGTTITMLAQYNLEAYYRQSINNNYVTFAGINGWEYSPGPKEIDIQTWSTNPKTYVNAYVEYLKEELEADSVAVDLITLKELQTLGCIIPSDYGHASSSSARTCTNSPYKSWLVNGQKWWTSSVVSGASSTIWIMSGSGDLNGTSFSSSSGVRPVITISKDTLKNLN